MPPWEGEGSQKLSGDGCGRPGAGRNNTIQVCVRHRGAPVNPIPAAAAVIFDLGNTIPGFGNAILKLGIVLPGFGIAIPSLSIAILSFNTAIPSLSIVLPGFSNTVLSLSMSLLRLWIVLLKPGITTAAFGFGRF